MKQKNMLPVKTLLKNLPRKTGGGQARFPLDSEFPSSYYFALGLD